MILKPTSLAPSRNRSSSVMLLSSTSHTPCFNNSGEELPLDEVDAMVPQKNWGYVEFCTCFTLDPFAYGLLNLCFYLLLFPSDTKATIVRHVLVYLLEFSSNQT